MIIRLAAAILALAITAFVLLREAGPTAIFLGAPVWWFLVPLWAVLLAFLFAIRRTSKA